MTDDEDFSNHPKSIGEIRAEKNWNLTDWTTRDALITTLRDIDSGKIKPDNLFIFMTWDTPGGGIDTKFQAAGRSLLEMAGTIELGKNEFMKASNDCEHDH